MRAESGPVADAAWADNAWMALFRPSRVLPAVIGTAHPTTHDRSEEFEFVKRHSLLLSALVALSGIATAQTAAPLPPPELPMAPPPAVQAKTWVLMDAASGQVLAGHDEHQRMAPACITKVMTSYVVAA